jgi:hypothetical protein
MGKSESSCSEEVPLGSDEVMPEISVLSASSSTSLPSLVSSQVSPASQPTPLDSAGTSEESGFPSLAFVGSSEESGSLSAPDLAVPGIVEVSEGPVSGIVEVSEGPVSSATVLPVPKAQLSVHGLTEAQAWLLGWLRDGTQNHDLLAFIDCYEAGTRRKNEVDPPPECSLELLKLKAKLARIQDENKESVIRNWALSIAASLGLC